MHLKIRLLMGGGGSFLHLNSLSQWLYTSVNNMIRPHYFYNLFLMRMIPFLSPEFSPIYQRDINRNIGKLWWKSPSIIKYHFNWTLSGLMTQKSWYGSCQYHQDPQKILLGGHRMPPFLCSGENVCNFTSDTWEITLNSKLPRRPWEITSILSSQTPVETQK